MSQVWEVVGGADKGGILVRDGAGTVSKMLKERLATGSLVLETGMEGDRIGYRLLKGDGPEEGWVSVKLKDKEMLKKSDQKASDLEVPEEKGPKESTRGIFDIPEEVTAMIKERCEKELEKPPYQWQWIDTNLVMNNHAKKAKGIFYKLDFPWNEETLSSMGPSWLTRAMHTAGTMARTNKVTRIKLETKIKVTTGNNGGKFLFEVEYAKPEPGLATKLFAKVPFPFDGKTKNDRLSSSVNKQPAELYEVNAYRLLESSLPMRTPRFYFGDMSNETSNWIIINERINFHDFEGNNFGPPGDKPGSLPPYHIEGPYDKCIDYNLRGDHKEYYLLLTTVGAKMAGVAKSGNLGSADLLLASFRASPSGSDPMNWGCNPMGPSGEAPKQVMAKLKVATDFISDVGKAVFPEFAHTKAFCDKFTEVMMKTNAYNAEISYWQHMDSNYVGLGHMNLNVDNAYFWRDDDAKLCCGVFDWGGMGTSSFGTKLWWWYYCMDYDCFEANLSTFLEAFADAYAETGGPKVDPTELRKMVILAAFQQMLQLVAAVPQIYKMCGKSQWPEIKDRYDPRIALNVDDKSTIRLYIHCMNTVVRIIELMKGDQVLDQFIQDIYVGKMSFPLKQNYMD